MSRRSFESTPLIEAFLDEVRKVNATYDMTTAEAIEWLLLDIGMYGEGVPAYGRLSPVAYSTLRRAYAEVGGKPGDLDDPDRPYRGSFRERHFPRNP